MLNSQKGVGLVEILIALIIFAFGISVAMRMLPNSNMATTRGRNITKATNLAQQKVEQLMDISYSAADLSSGTHMDIGNPIDNHFTRSWTVADDSPIKGMKSVTVTVSFSAANPDSSVTLATLITSRR
jgi:Tfp pilus assembly protein PilV